MHDRRPAWWAGEFPAQEGIGISVQAAWVSGAIPRPLPYLRRQALSFRAAELPRAFARRYRQRDREFRSARLQRTGPRRLPQYRADLVGWNLSRWSRCAAGKGQRLCGRGRFCRTVVVRCRDGNEAQMCRQASNRGDPFRLLAPRLAGIVAGGPANGRRLRRAQPGDGRQHEFAPPARGSAWDPPMPSSGSGGFPGPDGGAGRCQAGRMLALRWNRLPGSYCALILASRSYLAGP